MSNTKVTVALGVIGFVALLLIGNLVLAFGTVGEDEVHVETHWGESTGEVYEQNRYWLGSGIPNGISYSTTAMDTEPNTLEMQVQESLTRDGQDFSPVVSVTYQLNGEQAASFYADSERSSPFRSLEMWEERVGERAIESAVHGATASISALEMVQNYENPEDGADMATLRQELQGEVEVQLRQENEELSPEIDIIEVRVEDANPSQELSQAFEEVAIESAEAERQLIDAEADAAAEIARAEGQAEAFEILKDEYEGVDNALQAEWIEAIREDEGTIVLDAEAAPILNLQEHGNEENVFENEDDFFDGDNDE